MNFFADESLDRQIITRLRQDGHVVLDVTEMDPGISDDKVLSMANESKAILLTADRDFGDLVFRQGRITEGVVLIRFAGLPSTKKAELVSAIINQHAKELQQAFSVITPGSFRIRKINRLVWYDQGSFVWEMPNPPQRRRTRIVACAFSTIGLTGTRPYFLRQRTLRRS